MPTTSRRRSLRGAVSVPVASRPRIEGYGITSTKRGMVDWDDVRRAFTGAARYWIATTDADRSPHVQQHWGAFLDDRFYFEGGSKTRWARNLRRIPRAVVTAERLGLAIMVEGGVRALTPAPELADRLVKAFTRKYLRTDKYKPSPNNWDNDGLYAVTPVRAFAWRYRDFVNTATRFIFEKR